MYCKRAMLKVKTVISNVSNPSTQSMNLPVSESVSKSVWQISVKSQSDKKQY